MDECCYELASWEGVCVQFLVVGSVFLGENGRLVNGR